MFYFIVFICLSIASCHGIPVAEPVLCGVTPIEIYKCLEPPKIIKMEVDKQCSGTAQECELATCVYNKSGWMKDNILDKANFSAYFDQFVKENPDWQVAVEHVKTSCITPDLPPQGIHINCPAFDVMACVFAKFIKHAQPSQWSTSPECEYPRQYADACPVCPTYCFAKQLRVHASTHGDARHPHRVMQRVSGATTDALGII